MKKILFLDRDGTLIVEPPETYQVNSLEEMSFLPGVFSALKRFVDAGYLLVSVTNQDGLGTSANPRENYERINRKMFEIFEGEGIVFQKIFECPHFPKDNCDCRKPKLGILGNDFKNEEVDWKNSLMAGDRQSDMDFAKNLGIPGFLLAPASLKKGKVIQKGKGLSWEKIASEILDAPRIAEVQRKTSETDISVKWNLDGTGKAKISTGLNFLNHMLENFAKHGKFDLEISCKGDLKVDEHHTIEDIAIALGETLKKALGEKRGIARFSHEVFGKSTKILPMDEAISFIALDLSGRPFCVFDAEFSREFVGDVPTEMIEHFFRSFCDAAGVNLHLKIRGRNTHHQIEIAFKSFGRALSEAIKIIGTEISSTKGKL